MRRRDFLKTSSAAAAAMLPWKTLAAEAGWRTFEVTTRVEIVRPQGLSRAWVPLPLAEDTVWQRALGSEWSGNGVAQMRREPRYGATMVYAEWLAGTASPSIAVVSRFATRDRAVELPRPQPEIAALSGSEAAFFMAPTELIPTDGIVRETAQKIVKGARSDVDRARAVYEWIVDNTYRDPKVPGCGVGDIRAMLETEHLGGKCGDLNALFVGLARASGVPARDVYGIRVAPSALGYKSLGAGTAVISKAQHCRAEFYARGFGWVPVDPADVRKVVLEEPPGNLPLHDTKVAAARRRLFGSWEMNWLAYNTAHDVALPGSKGPKLAFLMYPNGETGGERLNQLEPESFKYSIEAREIRT